MSRQYLDVPYRSKDAAKALGARFDGAVKGWYVESGTDLVAFTHWVLTDAAPAASASTVTAVGALAATSLAPVRKGVTLSSLLNGVAAAVDQAFPTGVWVLVEVNDASARSGHVYLELSERDSTGQPDALVIIRGGGAINDLAWLNDYALARFICELTIPVMTGIGHERDSTLPDEVAHARFDTPSKVIAGIEQQILPKPGVSSAARSPCRRSRSWHRLPNAISYGKQSLNYNVIQPQSRRSVSWLQTSLYRPASTGPSRKKLLPYWPRWA